MIYPTPTLKVLEEETQIKTYNLRKLLTEMYEALFNYEEILDFGEVEINFIVSYLKRNATFKCKNLGHIPRVGDNICLPFLKAKVGSNYFYVEEVRHNLENNKQTIDITLLGGFYNAYWYYRKHKAIELKELSIHEQYDLYDFEMKEKLGLPKW